MVTLKDIAEAAGVSSMTVSRVLNSKTEYSRPSFAVRAQKIRKLADAMGYQPNVAARAISTGKFASAGLFVAKKRAEGVNAGSSVFVRGLVSRLDEQSIALSYAVVEVDQDSSPTLLRERRLDGMILEAEQTLSLGNHKAILGANMPVVLLNHRAEFDAAYPDEVLAAGAATRLALEGGHRRIALLGNTDSDHFSGPDRRAGYEKAMLDAGLKPEVIHADANNAWARAEAIAPLLRRADRPTALIVIEGVWQNAMVAAAMAGLRVPEDLSLVAIGQLANAHDAQLTHVRMPTYWVGRAAADLLVAKMISPHEPQPAVAVPYRHVDRGVTFKPIP
ncbi:MAG: LacI family DNA-binding transcriptional regulator [Planctomycetota bacterium]